MRYAGFQSRFLAGIVDFIVFVPLYLCFFLSFYFDQKFRFLSLFMIIVVDCSYFAYNIYLLGRNGQTFGKMYAGIKVLRVDGANISFKDAFWRHLVDILFAFLLCTAQIVAYYSVSDSQYASENDMIERINLISAADPFWYSSIDKLNNVWIWSELLILLFNKKRRALHDFIAGTIVVYVDSIKKMD